MGQVSFLAITSRVYIFSTKHVKASTQKCVIDPKPPSIISLGTSPRSICTYVEEMIQEPLPKNI